MKVVLFFLRISYALIVGRVDTEDRFLLSGTCVFVWRIDV
jgi:hypothetical protein